MTFDFGLGGITRLGTGLWDYLTEKAKGRAAVALEREWNVGTVETIKALSRGGGEVVDYDPNGRFRMIRRSGSQRHSPIVAVSQVQLPAIELPELSPKPPAGPTPENGAATE